MVAMSPNHPLKTVYAWEARRKSDGLPDDYGPTQNIHRACEAPVSVRVPLSMELMEL